MARVTIVTPYFWPECTASVPLMVDLASDLVKDGHSVSVLTSYPSRNVEKHALKEFESNRCNPEYYRGARILRFRNISSQRTGLVAKLQETLGFWFWAAVGSLLYVSKTDVFIVYSNPPLLSIPVSWSCIRKPVPIIYNLQDLFPDSAVKSGLLHESLLVKILRRMERKAYNRANTIVAVSPSLAEHVLNLTTKPIIQVIPNWVDTDSICYVSSDENRFLSMLPFDCQSKFIVIYAGNIGFAQNVDVIIDAAEKLQNVTDIVFVIAGEGQYKAAMSDRIHELGLQNTILLPLQPQESVAEVYSVGDVGLVTVREGIGKCSVPSKTWPMMACERPIIACIDHDSDLAHVINSSGAGLVLSPGDSNALAEAIMALYRDIELRKEMGMRGRAYVEENLSRRVITSAYCRLVGEIMDKSGETSVS